MKLLEPVKQGEAPQQNMKISIWMGGGNWLNLTDLLLYRNNGSGFYLRFISIYVPDETSVQSAGN